MEMSKSERIKRSILIIVIMVVALVSIISSREKRARKNAENRKEEIVEQVGDYNIDIIRVTNSLSKGSNYLISPYNIEVALNLLREGADGNTKDEIDKVIGNRKINDVSIENKIKVANGVFIKNSYKNIIKNDFINSLEDKYQAEVLYDDFKEPTVINNWVNNKTNGMIEKLLDKMDDMFVLGLASSLALDVKWSSEFECINTKEEVFIKEDKQEFKTEMMHQTYEYSAQYFENEDAKGIILPYEKVSGNENELEFVGIIPNTTVDEYINKLTSDKLNSIFNNTKASSSKLHINLSLPRFTYSYSIDDLKGVLNKMGIIDAFNQEKANFSKITDEERLYVSTAIHKTKIELNERGTKAAAVTFFGLDAMGLAPQDYEEINIEFNKPFIYMIREKNTNEILFFGTVYEPNEWKGSTCADE